mmetsp:Transcript_54553/g.100461  ORF Transcript_54553/g.100461 Transcript_54553/m.100461 type:complete len:174 (-) Transcript_54553:132-653(-)
MGLIGQPVCCLVNSLVCTGLALVMWTQVHFGWIVMLGTLMLELMSVSYVVLVFSDLLDFKNEVDRISKERVTDSWVSWTPEKVKDWLELDARFKEYAQKFEDEKIEGRQLPLLTEEHLKDPLGVKYLGDRLELHNAIQELCSFVKRPQEAQGLTHRLRTRSLSDAFRLIRQAS